MESAIGFDAAAPLAPAPADLAPATPNLQPDTIDPCARLRHEYETLTVAFLAYLIHSLDCTAAEAQARLSSLTAIAETTITQQKESHPSHA